MLSKTTISELPSEIIGCIREHMSDAPNSRLARACRDLATSEGWLRNLRFGAPTDPDLRTYALLSHRHRRSLHTLQLSNLFDPQDWVFLDNWPQYITLTDCSYSTGSETQCVPVTSRRSLPSTVHRADSRPIRPGAQRVEGSPDRVRDVAHGHDLVQVDEERS